MFVLFVGLLLSCSVILFSGLGLCSVLQILLRLCLCVCFFFQAEDGIRDLVRSRGLGDVYKRQRFVLRCYGRTCLLKSGFSVPPKPACRPLSSGITAVSYTHLTLPTSDLV